MTAEVALALELDAENQYLILEVGDEAFGVPILTVQEIIGYREVTPLPNTPAFLQGVLNLRGVIVPVVDLRLQFGMEPEEYNNFHVITIVQVCGKVMGIIVDAVQDALMISQEELRPRPDLASRMRTEFIAAIAHVKEQTILLLDLDRILTDDEIGVLDMVADPSQGELTSRETGESSDGLHATEAVEE